MFSLTVFRYQFTPSLRAILLCILGVAFFSVLGCWQLSRADEKQRMLLAFEQKQSLPAAPWSLNEQRPLVYKKIQFQGHFLQTQLLLDNQYYQHQFGYHVISIFELENKRQLLIDRGFVPGDISRRVLPKITTPEGMQILQGYVYYPSKKHWVLGLPLERQEGHLFVIETIDRKWINEVLHKSVYPFMIRLDKKSPHGFIREWSIVSMSPERHKGYALQWFTFALIVLVLFFGLNLKKHHEKNKTL